jgi:hypothetical protein
LGHKFGDSIFDGDHSKSADHLGGSSLVGSIGKKSLEPILKRLAKPILENPTSSEGFRGAADYMHSSIKGSNALDESVQKIFETGRKTFHEPNEDHRKALKEKIESAKENPDSLLEIGGSLGHYLPEHASALGATAASAVNYLNGLRPAQAQNNPLDSQNPVDKIANAKYERALDLAQNPLLAIQHAKDGSLQSQDITTIKTIYPELHKTMVSKIGEELINQKSKGTEIPYRSKIGLSMLMGQPLDSTMTQSAMMAIIGSSKNAAPESQMKPQGHKQGGETSVSQKAINTADNMYSTPLQKRIIDKKM